MTLYPCVARLYGVKASKSYAPQSERERGPPPVGPQRYNAVGILCIHVQSFNETDEYHLKARVKLVWDDAWASSHHVVQWWCLYFWKELNIFALILTKVGKPTRLTVHTLNDQQITFVLIKVWTTEPCLQSHHDPFPSPRYALHFLVVTFQCLNASKPPSGRLRVLFSRDRAPVASSRSNLVHQPKSRSRLKTLT